MPDLNLEPLVEGALECGGRLVQACMAGRQDFIERFGRQCSHGES